jgi:hypothetical protein
LLGGCATSRSILDIPAPTARGATQATDKEVLIASVTDRRSFETNPGSPNIPSLVKAATRKGEAFILRQRARHAEQRRVSTPLSESSSFVKFPDSRLRRNDKELEQLISDRHSCLSLCTFLTGVVSNRSQFHDGVSPTVERVFLLLVAVGEGGQSAQNSYLTLTLPLPPSRFPA